MKNESVKSPFNNLKPGSKAPAFKGIDQNGASIALKDYAGKKVVLYFYPKDDTPGCTAQACNLRDNYTNLLQDGFEIIGVSPDPAKKHKKFEEKYELPFALIADEDHSIAEKYGVWGEKKFMGKTYDGIHRTTFLIDETGKIKNIITKPDTKNHTDEVLAAWHE
ncbi:thioredoxin-dependent thiol peroxidase [Ferruginibacter yonginensis]|uniref:thioredoxin-dependent peroxiredoxin n=1 Tax=Ferruginibacter yonginensis TaxID=1310416 RepID=A0ABV8QSK4_9BACT